MVAVLEKIKVIIGNNQENIKNSLGEQFSEYTFPGTYEFSSGKVYGIVSEFGSGGEYISSLLSGNIEQNEDDKIFIDEVFTDNYKDLKIGWYMRAPFYNKGLIRREISVRKALGKAIEQSGNRFDFKKIQEEFGLQEKRLDLKLSYYSHEGWRASMAVGYVLQKQIFCFPWQNSIYFSAAIYDSMTYKLFNKITDYGGIIILPTSKKENVKNIADNIITIKGYKYNNINNII